MFWKRISKKRSVLVVLLLFALATSLSGCDFLTDLVSVRTVTAPYTMEYDDGMQVTFEGVRTVEEDDEEPKWEEVEAILKYENTLHTSNSDYWLPGILKLKTGAENIYESSNLGGCDPGGGYFKPEETRTEYCKFELHSGEESKALLLYQYTEGEYKPTLKVKLNSS